MPLNERAFPFLHHLTPSTLQQHAAKYVRQLARVNYNASKAIVEAAIAEVEARAEGAAADPAACEEFSQQVLRRWWQLADEIVIQTGDNCESHASLRNAQCNADHGRRSIDSPCAYSISNLSRVLSAHLSHLYVSPSPSPSPSLAERKTICGEPTLVLPRSKRKR